MFVSIFLSELRLSGQDGGSGTGLHGVPGVHAPGGHGASGGVGCPICGMPLRPADLEQHYTQELEYLAKLSAALLVNQQHQRVRKKVGF